MWRIVLAVMLCVASVAGYSQRSTAANDSFVASVRTMIDRWDATAQRHLEQDVACVVLRDDACLPPRVRGYVEGLIVHRQRAVQSADSSLPANALFRLSHDGVLRVKVATVVSLGGVW